MKTTAKQGKIHVSSQKANLVCDLVRGLDVVKAARILDNIPNKTARIIKKLMNSAIANATNNHNMIANKLYIYAITANQSKTIKRAIPRAKGSSSPIRKRFATICITLSDDVNQKQKDLADIKLKLRQKKKSASKKSNQSNFLKGEKK